MIATVQQAKLQNATVPKTVIAVVKREKNVNAKIAIKKKLQNVIAQQIAIVAAKLRNLDFSEKINAIVQNSLNIGKVGDITPALPNKKEFLGVSLCRQIKQK